MLPSSVEVPALEGGAHSALPSNVPLPLFDAISTVDHEGDVSIRPAPLVVSEGHKPPVNPRSDVSEQPLLLVVERWRCGARTCEAPAREGFSSHCGHG